eukprot:4131795-Lingulodinium_polyedra.AAC.1
MPARRSGACERPGPFASPRSPRFAMRGPAGTICTSVATAPMVPCSQPRPAGAAARPYGRC